MKRKILIIRFSSIGDIVLTSPVIRCLKKQLQNVEIHFLVKKNFSSIVRSNPYVDQVIEYEDISGTISKLKSEHYSIIIDLQKNMRSLSIKMALSVKNISFDKLNVEKWILVNLKINKLPKIHIVDRYMQGISVLGVQNDGLGLQYFIPGEFEVDLNEFTQKPAEKFIAIAIGAAHQTKKMPLHKWKQFVSGLEYPMIVLGGSEDFENGEALFRMYPHRIFNACGKLNLHQSASVIRQSQIVVAHDTGLMHIAAALKKPILSIWGNTVPDFGMYPYYGTQQVSNISMQNLNLSCRPCSKIGHANCPKKHFKCMEDQDISKMIEAAYKLLNDSFIAIE